MRELSCRLHEKRCRQAGGTLCGYLLALQKRFVRIAQPPDVSGVSRTRHSVLRGLGQCLNKQKNHSFRRSGMNGFSHLYMQMRKTLISASADLRVFCLLGKLPSPASSQTPYPSPCCISTKAHALRCSSFPRATRVAGLARGPYPQVPCELRT